MGVLDAVRRLLPAGLTGRTALSPGRKMQEEIDLSTLAVLMSVDGISKAESALPTDNNLSATANEQNPAHLQNSSTTPSIPGVPELDEEVERVLALNVEAHRELVAKHVDQQLEEMFGALEKASASAASPFAADPRMKLSMGSSSFDASQASEEHEDFASSPVEQHLQMVESYLRDSYGMVPRVAPSSISHPSAGDGVFVSGRVQAGRVVALYPGMVYLPFQVQRITDAFYRERAADYTGAQQRFEDLFGTEENRNIYATQLMDGTIINAALGSVSVKPNLFAVGHKVNHPPKGAEPNVMLCPFVFRKSMVDRLERGGHEFRNYIPNMYFKDPAVSPNWWWYLAADNDVLIRSLAYVSTRPIEDNEELFVNYRFDPNHGAVNLPEWYHPVDSEEDQMRWS